MEPNSSAQLSWAPLMRRRRSSSPPLISLPVLIILLPTLALILLFFAIRLLLSLTNQVFWPSSVRKSWDSFNVFLVLFAIICGIYGRRKDDESTAVDVGESGGSGRRMVEVNGDSELSQQGYEFAERRFYDSVMRTPGTAAVATDLRQESPRENGNVGNKFLFFDDFETNKFRSRSFSYRARGCEIEESPAEIKVIPVDTFVANSSPASHRMKSPNPQPPPPPFTRRKSRQTIQKKEEVREVSTNNAEIAKSQSPPLPPPPPPPRTVIPPSPIRVRLEEKFRKSERKKTNVKKEIAIALASLYRKRKTKQKARDIYDGDRHSPTDQRPPPPPPPPPPPSFFRIFKKQNKNKKAQSESAPLPPVSSSSRSTKKKFQIPPPPSPPPPPSSRQQNSTASPRPPLPPRVQNSTVGNQVINSAIRNPSETIPPPYKTTTDVKSGVRGDTVGSRSSETFHCGSPEPDNVGSSSTNGTSEPGVEVNGVGPVFCPSPDVNIKAANFIARLRGEWRLEKMNSVREKEILGQGPNYELRGAGLGPNV